MTLRVIGPISEVMSGTVAEVVAPLPGMSQEEFDKLARSILIVIPYRKGEGINGDLALTTGFWALRGTPCSTHPDPFGGMIELTRAEIAKTFLLWCMDHPECDKLVMIDSDENVPWDAPYRLAQWDRPIVSGVVCNFTPSRGVFACFQMKDRYGKPRFPSRSFTKTMPAMGLKEVDSVGTGLICIKKDVIKAIFDSGENPFFIPQEVKDQSVDSGILKQGEDIAFCRQAEALGFKIYVDLSVHAAHIKLQSIMWPKGGIDYDLDAQEWEVSDKDYAHG